MILFLLGLIGSSCSDPAPTNSNTVMIQFLVAVPEETKSDDVIYLAGDLPQVGAWKPAGLPLKRRDDGTYAAIVELPKGKALDYKITRGSWQTVEKGPAGEEIPNRTLALNGNAIEKITVAKWASAGDVVPVVRQRTISGDVLLGIAMPLKYMAGMPEVVRVVGLAHGLLFILYLFSIGELLVGGHWGFKKAVIAFFAALLPFGTFVLELSIRRERAREAAAPSG